MALQQLAGSNAQNYMPFNPNDPSVFRRLDGPLPGMDTLNSNRDHGAWLGGGIGSGGGLASIEGGFNNRIPRPGYGNPPPLTSISRPGFGISRPMPLPDYNIGRLPPTLGIAQPDYSGQFEKFGEKLGGFGETLGGYSGQFEKFGEQLGGLGEQMTGYQDALGSFNEQIGGMGKQFEAVNNKLDSLEKGIASLQQVQPQQQSYNPYASMMGMFNPYNRFSYGRRFG
jgi:hypothetical protein